MLVTCQLLVIQEPLGRDAGAQSEQDRQQADGDHDQHAQDGVDIAENQPNRRQSLAGNLPT